MSIFTSLKEKLSDAAFDLRWDLEMKMIDLKHGHISEKVKVVADAGAFFLSPALYLGVKAGKKVVDGIVDDKINSKVQERTAELKALHVAELDRLNMILEEMTPLDFYNFNVAGGALAFAAANSDGELSNEEREEIIPLLLGESAAAAPQNLINIFTKFAESPPSLFEALEYVKKVDKRVWDSFDGIVEMTINIDGVQHDGEKMFYQYWIDFKKQNGAC